MHILIIRPGAVGDTLLTFPVIKALRAQYTNSHITFVSNAAVLPLAQAFGIVDEISDYGNTQWSELFSTAGIRNLTMQSLLQQIDLAICWLRDSDGLVEHNVLNAGAKQVIAAPGRPPAGKRMHVVEYLAETVGVNLNEFAQFKLPTNNNKCSGRGASGGDPNPYGRQVSNLIAIHPGSGGTQKCWPPSSFAAVIERLWQYSYPVLLFAGPADTERLKHVLNHLSSPPQANMLSILDNAQLLDVARQLQQCRYYLGNDSGITHLAAMLGIPTLALFGPSDPLPGGLLDHP